MVVVSNTSPLSNLAVIGKLNLLRDQFGSALVPPAVHGELALLRDSEASRSLDMAFRDGWVRVTPLLEKVPAQIASGLHAGESAALALALERKADLTLLDDGDARRRAIDAGLRITGTLGVLLKAGQSGQIRSLREEMHRLREKAHFFIAPRLERELLAAAGETPA